MFKNIPNILTISRIIVIPFIVISFFVFESSKIAHIVAATLFLYASITDFLDGYLARIYLIQSRLGAFLDPIADKLLVVASIVMLIHFRMADILPALAIICREILVSGLREFLADIRISIPVSNLAKIKTAVQMAAIFMLLLGSKGSGIAYLSMIGRVSLWVAAALTLLTGYAYLKASLRNLSETN